MQKNIKFNYKISKKIVRIFLSNWGPSIHNKLSNGRVKPLIEKGLFNPKKENIYFMINILVKKFLENKTYLEIGTHRGASIISAAYKNPSTRCIGIDHFELHHKPGEDIEQQLIENIKKFNVNNIEYYKTEAVKGINYLFEKEPKLKIDLFYYDATHEYKPQLEIMEKMIPYLADDCLLCVDDLLVSGVLEALQQFLERNLDFCLRFLIVPTVQEGNWWKGWAIITRGELYD